MLVENNTTTKHSEVTMTNNKQNSLTDLQLNDLEQWAWDNPCLSRSDVYTLFEEVFETKRLTFDKTYAISASKEVYDFTDRLRKLAKERGELLKPTKPNSYKQSSIEWLIERLKTREYLLDQDIEQAKEMEIVGDEIKYADGYLEGFNRALDLVELTVEEYKYDIFYDRGLIKIHDRIKELRG